MFTLLKRYPITIVIYVLTMLAIVVGIVAARGSTIAAFGTRQAQHDWEKWRNEATQQTNDGTVVRRQPKSLEPPALVLMRDHFAVVVAAGVVFGSMLFLMLAVAIHGTTAKSRKTPENQPFSGD